MTPDEIAELLLPLDDIETDADGLCHWAEVADARDVIADALASRALPDGGFELAAKWHDARARHTPDVFEQELHEKSAKAIRALAAGVKLDASGLSALAAAPPNMTDMEPSVYLHTLHMELGQKDERLRFTKENPYGKPGKDYSEEYRVTCAPLYDPDQVARIRDQAKREAYVECLELVRSRWSVPRDIVLAIKALAEKKP
ncbi:hypothetical protein [Chelatococcus sp.]|uniref:hypothetical protein n=1 Tax=Chelatococcus sp. TaxID=1953771 RepID=UPI001EB6A842|nr:hypothetical protein [Chelatococcus sp.]MBX3547454.1 hypothetical protein [Chelatococcus sp.]CAH1678333.1 hypothetical protein CHELA41_24521 [Hyphomicrobiales bacterium]